MVTRNSACTLKFLLASFSTSLWRPQSLSLALPFFERPVHHPSGPSQYTLLHQRCNFFSTPETRLPNPHSISLFRSPFALQFSAPISISAVFHVGRENARLSCDCWTLYCRVSKASLRHWRDFFAFIFQFPFQVI